MFRRVIGFLFGQVPFEVTTAYSFQVSVERLRAATKRSIFSSLLTQAAVGPVEATRVRLQRVIPFFGNSFKPVFYGRFEEIGGRVVLRGEFTMFFLSKIIMSLWLVFPVVWTISATIGSGGGTSPQRLATASFGFGFLFLGVAFLRFCWWLSRGDMEYLKRVMYQSLQAQPDGTANRGQPLSPDSTSTPPAAVPRR